jgi:glyoxylase-like metal-dependent hydrolase (beta-lactamase superfamily II)
MPGHLSLYVRQLRTLITGDALVVSRKRLVMSNAQYATDVKEAKNTARKLFEMDAERYICDHGGVVTRHGDNLNFGE